MTLRIRPGTATAIALLLAAATGCTGQQPAAPDPTGPPGAARGPSRPPGGPTPVHPPRAAGRRPALPG
ncbi:hypothetical protein AB0E92_20730, partial [Streptomyces griseus]